MKLIVIVLLGLATLALGRPNTILDFEGDDHDHKQEGDPGSSVDGTFSWTSPEGNSFVTHYVADKDGFRVVESNAVPVNADGVAADGNQGSFVSEEEGGEGGEEGGEEEEEERR